MTLQLDALSFFLAFALVYFLPNHEPSKQKSPINLGNILRDIKEGLVYIRQQKEIFFLLLVASAVNFFFAAFNYLLPFTNQLYEKTGSYATILSLGAIGSIIGAILASKVKASMGNLLVALLLTGVGVAVMGVSALLPVHPYFSYSGNLICELFMTVFNIHFFSQVQTKVDKQYLGRVFSTIYTLAILFMPPATFLMTLLPSVRTLSFLLIGFGVMGLALISYLYQKKIQTN